jgi:dTDP-4-dehydrorhamnose 3,5-epimerase
MYQVLQTEINGCIEIQPKVFNDQRGCVVKPYHREAFEKVGVFDDFQEDLLVVSRKKVLRGLHYQTEPFSQAKLVYCIRGKILDAAVDLRRGSPTWGKHVTVFLDAEKRNSLYIPTGFAHGYFVLEEETIVGYKLSSLYSPENEGGIHWNSAGIEWPTTSPIISEKDMLLPRLDKIVSPFNYVSEVKK